MLFPNGKSFYWQILISSVLGVLLCPDAFVKFICLVYIDMTRHQDFNEAVTECHVSNLTDQGLAKDSIMKNAPFIFLSHMHTRISLFKGSVQSLLGL